MTKKALQDQAAKLVSAAIKAGADSADAGVVSSNSVSVSIRDGAVENTERSENDGFFLRVFIGDQKASVSANDISAVDELAARAVAMAKVSPDDPYASLADPADLETNFVDLDLYDETEITSDALIEMAMEGEASALSVEGVTKSSGASAGWASSGFVLVGSNGFSGGYKSSHFGSSVSIIAGEGTSMERDYDYDSRRFLSDLKSPSEIGEEAGRRVVARCNPRKVKTQKAPVMYDPRVSPSLLGSLLGAINGASIARESSFLKDKMGAQLFDKAITITDDPLLKRGAGSRPHDGEGVRCAPLTIIDEGKVKTWLLDTATARELKLKTNGRAGRAGANPSPSSTNVTLQPGTLSPEEMMQEIGTGLYVTELIGSGANIITGDYSRGAAGFWIENGEIAYPVSEITIASNLNDMFASLRAASDLTFRGAVNAPTVLIDEMTIAGS